MIINSIKLGKTPLLHNPFNRNDFIYVTDVSRALHFSIKINIDSGIYNLGSGEGTCVYDLLCLVGNLMNTNEKFESVGL